jgi:PAS domain S-box-containing protein
VDVTDLKRVEEDLRRNLEELRVVTTVAECTADAGDEEALLARVTAVIRDSLFTEACGFWLVEDDADLVRPSRSFHARRGADALAPVRLGQGVVGEVAQTGESRRIDDVRADGPGSVAGCHSEVCVPLKVGARVLGVLVAASAREAAFTEGDERLLLVVASHVANALVRVRGEEGLRRSREMYRAYFTASPLAVFVADTRGRYLEVNGAACALTGYGRDELLGMSLSDLLAADDAAGLGDRLTGLLALGGARNEIGIRRKDGEARHCLVHATAIGEDRLLGFLLDITDRRQAEEKVKESEERFRGLSEASLEAILVHEGGRIVDVNHALCELGGYAWHELVGRDAFEFIAPEDRETVYRTLLSEYSRPYEISGLRRDGTRVPLEVRARSFPFQGQSLRVVALRDISERKRAEEVRESLIRDLEAKNAELERFLHTVSHDLKAPLITIRGFVQYLLRDVGEGRTDRLKRDAGRISEAAGTMQRLLDHLVELSHTGREVGSPEPVSLEKVVREALGLVEGRRAGSRVTVEIGEGLPVVFGDHSSLVQVFQNLLDNAVKFSAAADEPRVWVEAAAVGVGQATVAVRDNGPGIDPTHHQRVFGLFEKLDPHAEGTGVGLAVVKRIVETHGGSATVESRGTDTGTAIRITLPTPPAEGKGPGGDLREVAQRRTG